MNLSGPKAFLVFQLHSPSLDSNFCWRVGQSEECIRDFEQATFLFK